MTAQMPLQVAVGVIKNAHNQVLVALRPAHVHQGDLWEFPGGKIAAHETVSEALARELQEELAIRVEITSPLITLQHRYADLEVQLHVRRVDQYSGQARGNEGQEIRWVTLNDLATLRFPEANAPIITAVQLPDYYAILDAEALVQLGKASALDIVNDLLRHLQSLLEQSITLIQARLKNLNSVQCVQFLEKAVPLCAKAGVCLLINSAISASWDSADGVHFTSHDLMRLQQRPKQLRWVAASCHTLAQLQHAQAIGVDFVVLAPVLPTLSHEDTPALGWENFAAMVAAARVPVYALGGLTQGDLAQAKFAGAQGVAGIRLFWV